MSSQRRGGRRTYRFLSSPSIAYASLTAWNLVCDALSLATSGWYFLLSWAARGHEWGEGACKIDSLSHLIIACLTWETVSGEHWTALVGTLIWALVAVRGMERVA